MPSNTSLEGVVAHEMGHHLVARAAGFQVLGIRIKRDQRAAREPTFHGAAETAIISPIRIDAELDTYLRARIMVLSAGALAQAFDGEQVDRVRLKSIREGNGSMDLSSACELFAVYLNRRMGRNLDFEYAESNTWQQHPFWKECEHQATDIVRSNWSTIERVVADAVKQFKTHFNYERTPEQILEIGQGSVR